MKMNSTTVYERIYRKFHRPIVISYYMMRFTRIHYWRMMTDPLGRSMLARANVGKDRILEKIELDDVMEIGDCVSMGLRQPGLRMYAVYSDGSTRRIKIGPFMKFR